MNASLGDKFEAHKERRAAVRYRVSLQVEVSTLSRLPLFETDRLTTRDASICGFYFVTRRACETGERLKFSILAPGEIEGRTAILVGGVAKCIRVEEIQGSDSRQYGIGARIEKVYRRSPGSRAFASTLIRVAISRHSTTVTPASESKRAVPISAPTAF